MASDEDAERALEASEADRQDQRTPVSDDPNAVEDSDAATELPMEADEGDLLDQAIPVPADDEDSAEQR
jgi:hypothetical protein